MQGFHKTLFLLLGLPLLAHADIHFKAGNWQVTSKVSIEGLAIQAPEQTHKQCISAEQAQRGLEESLKATLIDGCTMSDYSVKQQQAHWKMACGSEQDAQNALQGEAWLTIVDAQHYHSKIVLHSKTPDKTIITTTHTQSQWLGACSD